MRRTALAALVVACACVVTGCRGEAERPETTESGPVRIEADWSKLGSRDHLYLQVNTDGAKHYEIVRVDLATGGATQITDIPGPFGVSMFSVSRAGLVVAQAPDFVDEVARLTSDGTLEPLPHARGSAPDINNAGDVAALRPVGKRSWELMLQARGTHTWRGLGPGPLTRSAWLDSSTLALFKSEDGSTVWRTMSTDDGRQSRPREIAVGHYAPADYGVRDNDRPLLLLGGKGEPALLWRPGRRAEQLPPASHRATCLSPDGTQALLTGGKELAVMSIDTGEVRAIAEPGPRVLGCAWVKERFGPE